VLSLKQTPNTSTDPQVQLQNLWANNLKFYVKVIVNCRNLNICKGTAMVHFEIMRGCSFGKIEKQRKDSIGIDTKPTEI
jgi:hypothetical protein